MGRGNQTHELSKGVLQVDISNLMTIYNEKCLKKLCNSSTQQQSDRVYITLFQQNNIFTYVPLNVQLNTNNLVYPVVDY